MILARRGAQSGVISPTIKTLGKFQNMGWVPKEVRKKLDQANASSYQLKITLVGLEPTIWRQVLVPGDVNLAGLHWVIQCVMGWSNSHLHMFHVGKQRFGPKTPDWDDVQDERKVILQDIAPKAGTKFFYEYDMGDSWMHQVKIEKITQLESGFQKPECLAGERVCPPEDCGGIGGYEDMLAALRDPKHEQHDEMVEWIGEDFNPEDFDLALENKALGHKAEISKKEGF